MRKTTEQLSRRQALGRAGLLAAAACASQPSSFAAASNPAPAPAPAPAIFLYCLNTGTIRGCSIINMEFIGQTRPPPYAYAEIVLDGASTRLIHMIEIESIAWAKEHIRPGRRVRAIWTTGERTGSLRDIERFELIDE